MRESNTTKINKSVKEKRKEKENRKKKANRRKLQIPVKNTGEKIEY